VGTGVHAVWLVNHVRGAHSPQTLVIAHGHVTLTACVCDINPKTRNKETFHGQVMRYGLGTLDRHVMSHFFSFFGR